MIQKAKTTVNKLKVAIIAMFSFCFLFICIGYAELTDTATIEGNVTATVQDNVFIVDVLGATSNFNLSGFGGTTFVTTFTQGDEVNELLSVPLATASDNGDFYYYTGVTIMIPHKYDSGHDVLDPITFANDYNITVSTNSLTNIMFGRGLGSKNNPQHSDEVNVSITGTPNSNVNVAIRLNYEKIENFDEDVVFVNFNYNDLSETRCAIKNNGSVAFELKDDFEGNVIRNNEGSQLTLTENEVIITEITNHTKCSVYSSLSDAFVDDNYSMFLNETQVYDASINNFLVINDE